MEARAILVIEVIVVDRHELDPGALRQIHRLVENQATVTYLRFERHLHNRTIARPALSGF